MNNDIAQLINELVEDCKDLTNKRRGELVLALGQMGPAALDPILEALAQTDHEPTRHALLDAASSLSVHDGRLKSHLVELLGPHPMLAAMLLSGYDDPSTLPDLRGALDRLKAGASVPLADNATREIERAIETLDQDAKDIDEHEMASNLEELRREREELEHENARLRKEIAQIGEPYRTRASEKLRRNDPCWCGSGRKYKRCHRGSDGA